MGKEPKVTRIDMVDISGGRFQVVRFAEGAGEGGRTIAVGEPEVKVTTIEEIVKAFEPRKDWTLRVFDGGARAWLGGPRSVRSRNAILRKAEALRAKGKNSSAFDLRYDLF